MTMQRRNIHVYIIESPNAPDLYLKRFEGESLEKTLKLSSVSSSHRLAVNREAFNAAFFVGLKEYFETINIPPIIHISAHGDDNGIQLTSGEIISWEELRTLLTPVNTVLKGSLLVCMSSCKGFSGIKMAMEDDDMPFPFLAMIGNMSKPTWGETNVAFSTFYHLFAKGEDPSKAVEAMKLAAGNNGFTLDFAVAARKRYQDILKSYTTKVNQSSAVSTIENATPKGEETLVKALK